MWLRTALASAAAERRKASAPAPTLPQAGRRRSKGALPRRKRKRVATLGAWRGQRMVRLPASASPRFRGRESNKARTQSAPRERFRLSARARRAGQDEGAGAERWSARGAKKSQCRKLEISAPHDVHPMAPPAIPEKALADRAGAVRSARLLARLRKRALPAGARCLGSASVLLGAQRQNVRRGTRAGRRSMQLAA